MKPDDTHLSFLIKQISEKDDEKSFEALFKLLYKPLCRFARRYAAANHTAEEEEIVSDVFVKIWSNRRQLAHVRNIRLYMYVAVKNQAWMRNNSSPLPAAGFPDADLAANHFADDMDPSKELELQELQASIELSVASLPQQCRTVFKLIKEEGFKYKEVAEVMNLSVRTVETHLATALKKLATALRPPELPPQKKAPEKKTF